MSASDTASACVRELMSQDVHTVDRNDRLSVADDILTQERIRHLVVLDEEGDVAGVLSQRDLFRGALVRAFGYGSVAQRKVMDTIPVKEVMACDPVTIEPSRSIAEAARLLEDHKIGCLPVIEAGTLVGILTEGSLVGYLAREA